MHLFINLAIIDGSVCHFHIIYVCVQYVLLFCHFNKCNLIKRFLFFFLTFSVTSLSFRSTDYWIETSRKQVDDMKMKAKKESIGMLWYSLLTNLKQLRKVT